MIKDIQLPPGGIVLGVGIDLVENARIKQVLDRHQDRFVDRVFTEAERAYCFGMKNPLPHLAARFAAKEAVSKAFSTGIGAELGWRSIEIVKGSRDEPLVKLDEQGKLLLAQVGGDAVLVSLSHTENYAQAIGLIIKYP